ncbi:MAG: M48 family metallopeptidase [Acidobacteria bacterium]|nr:M48 family metallopeptidase [Acidobacteriota bacterium]MCI0722356.1 M48 family metallopeptidase [Acidobacteriota bacterium]
MSQMQYNKKGWKHLTSSFAAIFLASLPALLFAQGTRLELPKNKYQVEDDLELGRKAAAQAEREFPLLRDGEIESYVNQVGQRIVDAIPAAFQHPQFRYTFKVVNAGEINAFALPGGPMFVNRGMIEAARTEGEMAGVMGHEISHVALRHATAQATEAQKFQIGSILGQIAGGVIGGGLGDIIGMGSQIGFGAGALRYSRKYESQADILGTQLIAKIGYDPRDLANMFRTIERQGSRGGPEWLSSHPNPGKRYERIEQEARLLGVDSSRSGDSAAFRRIQQRLRNMPSAPARKPGQGQRQPSSGEGAYSGRAELPSSTYRQMQTNRSQLSVPDNWREFRGDTSTAYVPEGAYGQQGITHGVLISAERATNSDLRRATEQHVESLLQGNPYLRQQSSLQGTRLAGQRALATTLAGRSPITGRTERVTLLTTFVGSDLFCFTAISPEEENQSYQSVFQRILSSLRFLR